MLLCSRLSEERWFSALPVIKVSESGSDTMEATCSHFLRRLIKYILNVYEGKSHF